MPPNTLNPAEGAGPFQFVPAALDAGESQTFDFREIERNGRKGWFRPILPLDSVQVTNQSTDNPVQVTINGKFQHYVVPSAIESVTEQGVVRIEVANVGSTTIPEGDIRLEVERTPYDADDEARASASRPWIQRAIDDIVPGGLPGGRGGRRG